MQSHLCAGGEEPFHPGGQLHPWQGRETPYVQQEAAGGKDLAGFVFQIWHVPFPWSDALPGSSQVLICWVGREFVMSLLLTQLCFSPLPRFWMGSCEYILLWMTLPGTVTFR